MIWTPKRTILEPKREILLPTRLRGFFKFEAVDRRGRRRVLADWFPNLITNAGLNIIGTAGGYLSRCRVGTGSAAPAVTDTELDSLLAATNTRAVGDVTTNSGASDYYTSKVIVYRFGEGVAEGNLTEVGIATSDSGATLFSRALILDGIGSPTTITVLADETLDVTYELRNYPALTDVTDTITISGDDYDYTLRPASVSDAASWGNTSTGGRGGMNSITGVGTVGTAYSGAIGAVTTIPSGTSANITSAVDTAYGNNNYYRDWTAVWGLSAANFGGVRSFMIPFGSEAQFGRIQVEFDPVIPKTSSDVLSMVFRHVWARGTI